MRVKSLDASDTLVEFNKGVTVYASADNATQSINYAWYENDVPKSSGSDHTFQWTAPGVAGKYKIGLKVTSGTATTKDSITISVVAHIPLAPVINSLTSDKIWYHAGDEAILTCAAENMEPGALEYIWDIPGGAITSQADGIINWKLPEVAGLYTVSCSVKMNLTFKSQTRSKYLLNLLVVIQLRL